MFPFCICSCKNIVLRIGVLSNAKLVLVIMMTVDKLLTGVAIL